MNPQRQEGDEAEAPHHQKETVAGSRPSLLPRHLDDGAGAAGAAAEAELDAPVTEEAREGADEEEAGGAASALTREFPAMVVPKVAVATDGQESGPLPSQWYNLREEYGQGCLFLLTLQVRFCCFFVLVRVKCVTHLVLVFDAVLSSAFVVSAAGCCSRAVSRRMTGCLAWNRLGLSFRGSYVVGRFVGI